MNLGKGHFAPLYMPFRIRQMAEKEGIPKSEKPEQALSRRNNRCLWAEVLRTLKSSRVQKPPDRVLGFD